MLKLSWGRHSAGGKDHGKQANGLRHPSKKEAQGSKSSKRLRRNARLQKSLKSGHHAHTKRKFQKLQTVETGGPLLEETCKPSKQNANFLGRTDNGQIMAGSPGLIFFRELSRLPIGPEFGALTTLALPASSLDPARAAGSRIAGFQ